LPRIFQFTEADAWTLLSVYGFHALEVDRLQNNRSNEPDQSLKNLPLPADLDTALAEIAWDATSIGQKVCRWREPALGSRILITTTSRLGRFFQGIGRPRTQESDCPFRAIGKKHPHLNFVPFLTDRFSAVVIYYE
jgi:hypothetical protein